MRVVWAFALAVTLSAGCLQGQTKADEAGVPFEPMDVELIPVDRPVVAATTWHEEVHRTTPRPIESGFIIENEWEPRDVELTYHGIQPVYDEWGREVPAHVFRYETMQLEVTSVEFLDLGGVRITARYEPSLVELAFDQATGRSLGTVYVGEQMRVFADHRWPSPFASGYSADLLLPVAFQFLGGDLSRPVVDAFGETFLNRTDLKPLDGDCQPYEYEFTPAPWYQKWMDEMGSSDPETPALPEDEQHHVVCLQDEGVPLWVFSGNNSDNLQLTRRSEPLPAPILQGEGLAPRLVEARPFELLPMTLGLTQAVDVPPSAYPGDWADQVRPVIQGVGTNLDYLQWQIDRTPLYVTDVSKAFPYFGAPLLPLVPVNPIPFESTSWVWVADGASAFWAFVDSRYGGVEDPDLHLSQQGFAIDDYPTRSADIVASGEVQAYWEPQLPIEAAFLSFSSFPDIFEDVPPEYVAILAPYLTSWSAQEFCFEEREGGRFASFSALNGQMMALGGQTSTASGCSSGVDSDGWLRLPMGGQEVWLRRAVGEDPAVLAFPANGVVVPLDPRRPVDAASLARALAQP